MSNLATILLGLVKVVATLASLLLVDKLGRRTLLLTGVGVIVVSLACLVSTATYQEVHEGRDAVALAQDGALPLA